jgi:hypothetical protein
MKQNLICIIGVSSSGKDTVYTFLDKKLRAARIHPIADLKSILELIYLVDLDSAKGKTTKTHQLTPSDEITLFNFLYRRYGTAHPWFYDFVEFLADMSATGITCQELMVQIYHFMLTRGDKEFSKIFLSKRLGMEFEIYATVCCLSIRNTHEIDAIFYFLAENPNIALTVIEVRRKNNKRESSDVLHNKITKQLLEKAKYTYSIRNDGTVLDLYNQLEQTINWGDYEVPKF